jgi:hypothetical protein
MAIEIQHILAILGKFYWSPIPNTSYYVHDFLEKQIVSAAHEIPRISWNPKIYYHVHKRRKNKARTPAPASILTLVVHPVAYSQYKMVRRNEIPKYSTTT